MRNKVKCSRNRELYRAGKAPVFTRRPSPAGHAFPAAAASDSSAAVSEGKAPSLLQEQKDVQIAPIFLQALRRVKGTRSDEHRHPVVPLVPHGCSQSPLQLSLEQIQTSNPTFAVQTVFRSLQEKTAQLHDDAPAGLIHQQTVPESVDSSQKQWNERKRGAESPDRTASKRLRRRSLSADEGAAGLNPRFQSERSVQKNRSSKLSRTHRVKQQRGSEADAECDDQSRTVQESPLTEAAPDDRLWTDKYSPRHSSEVIGNRSSVSKLHSWLKRWKRIADREETKTEECVDGTGLWDRGDFQGETGAAEDGGGPSAWNAVLITGPPGVGKTASVYACAQELGFKVFEVNCSSQRNGRHVLTQLQEATQSHLVETSGEDALRPTVLHNYRTSSCAAKPPDALPAAKPAFTKSVTATSKRKASQRRCRSGLKGPVCPAKVTLTNYFRTQAKADRLHFGATSASERPETRGRPRPPGKKTTTSLILFEEVDVIFDDDVGFLSAVKTFMTTTKRPVVLTTNDPWFRERLGFSAEEIVFKSPSAVNVCSYLRLVCLAEQLRLEPDDVGSLVRLSGGDVRRCLLQLQLWGQRGRGVGGRGGWTEQKRTLTKWHSHPQVRQESEANLRVHDSSCTASVLGLETVTQTRLLNFLKCVASSEAEVQEQLMFLSESWRGAEPLLYNNLDLLPTAASHPVPHHTPPEPRSDAADHTVQPKYTASLAATARNVSRRRKRPAHASESTPRPTLTRKAEIHRSQVRERADCMEALSDLHDLMSCLDVMLPGPFAPERFVWTGARVTDGTSDEVNEVEEEEEEQSRRRRRNQERLLEVTAVAEGLGCRRCWRRTAQTWKETTNYGHDVEEEMPENVRFPASEKRRSLRFIFQPPCGSSVSQRRYELSRKLLGSRSFSLLGNRRAVAVDYMPILRFLCRFHRGQGQREEPLRRQVNYLSSINVDLSKSTIQLLAQDFP